MHGYEPGNVVPTTELVEQALGILMFVYNLSAKHALGVLTWRAKESDIRLEDLSAALVRDVTSEDVTPGRLDRHVNRVLLNARSRIADNAV